MKLSELEPAFLVLESRTDTFTRRKEDGTYEEVTETRPYFKQVHSLQEAQGIEFLCPQCFAKNKGIVGTHVVICWFKGRGIPDDAEPGPGRWAVAAGSTSIDNLTLTPSISVPNDWHGYITNGEIVKA